MALSTLTSNKIPCGAMYSPGKFCQFSIKILKAQVNIKLRRILLKNMPGGVEIFRRCRHDELDLREIERYLLSSDVCHVSHAADYT